MGGVACAKGRLVFLSEWGPLRAESGKGEIACMQQGVAPTLAFSIFLADLTYSSYLFLFLLRIQLARYEIRATSETAGRLACWAWDRLQAPKVYFALTLSITRVAFSSTNERWSCRSQPDNFSPVLVSATVPSLSTLPRLAAQAKDCDVRCRLPLKLG